MIVEELRSNLHENCSATVSFASRTAAGQNRRLMKRNRFLTTLIVSIGAYFVLATPFALQSTPIAGTTFTIFFGDGSSIVATSTDLVGLQPNQVVDVTVRIGRGDAAPDNPSEETIIIEPLDGGSIVSGSDTVTVTPDNSGTVTFSFSFQAGSDPGVSQISLHGDIAEEIGIQIWVLDPDDPNNNPPSLTAQVDYRR
jgi:hypothetical protein